MTLVLVKRSLRPFITRVQTSEKGVGLLGFGGNKAGVAVRCRIHDTVVCFVNARQYPSIELCKTDLSRSCRLCFGSGASSSRLRCLEIGSELS